MSQIPNPQIDLAFDYIQNTNKNIFLTGKAGTGKTTFLRRVKKEIVKQMVVVAPTGVAAINAQGMTIHSFFQMPFGPFIPDAPQDASRQRRFNSDKLDLIRSLDLLIIDEISMVRSDLLDSIDDVLRRYKDASKPFGGVQLLMIGDLHQLPPVVKRDEWNLLSKHYSTPYFFGSLALQKTDSLTIELLHIYRQSDSFFIDLLNKVRNNQMTTEVLEAINSRYIEDFKPKEKDAYITLTSHNKTAYEINNSKLKAINKPLHSFKAVIKDKFPEHTYPTEEVLEFKIGAQIVFIKNDSSYEKRFYNGKIGKIEAIESDKILVRCPNESELITVSQVTWDNIQYSLDATTKEVSEDIIGSFTQYPLKLAWAITIHKSQGLTFEKAVIDAQSAFAHGQVYVALSRCKSFEGIVLLSKIGYGSIKTDRVVSNYSEEASKNPPNQDNLQIAKRDYQQMLIRELFDFRKIATSLKSVHRVLWENESKFAISPITAFDSFQTQLQAEVVNIAHKFQPKLDAYFQQGLIPENHETLLERIKKASVYFTDKLAKEFLPTLKRLPIGTDNQATQKQVAARFTFLEKGLFTKKECFSTIQTGFTTQKYIKTKTNADLRFQAYKRETAVNSILKNVPTGTTHPKLYAQLLQWRNEQSDAQGLTPYEVLPTRALHELTEQLPTDTASLLKIKGIGKVKARHYGAAIADMIDAYCLENNISSEMKLMFAPKTKKKKQDTKKVSLDMFNAGKDIETIASERQLKESTIQGHLAHAIGLGHLSVFLVMERESVDEVAAFCLEKKTTSSADVKAHFDDKYTYNEIKMLLAHLKRNGV
ncbi:MAG: helix-turn-helix domain-containing protein [Saprospiraceae bacterium]